MICLMVGMLAILVASWYHCHATSVAAEKWWGVVVGFATLWTLLCMIPEVCIEAELLTRWMKQYP